jgi:FkbM family methyltransferase
VWFCYSGQPVGGLRAPPRHNYHNTYNKLRALPMKRMGKSEVLFHTAERFPRLTEGALWLWVKGSHLLGQADRACNHWTTVALVKRLHARIPVHTRLGNGMKIKVHACDHVGGEILRSGYYEPRTVRLIQSLAKPGMVFVDVGAHVGQYTLIVSEAVTSTGSVHAFEPDPETYGWLRHNIECNRLTNVFTNQLALADVSGTLDFYLSDVSDIGANSLQQPRGFDGRVCKVGCTTLDEYMRSQGITRVDLMKIDVEGAELAMLKGSSALLERDDRPVIILEFEEARQRAFHSSCAQLAALLESKRYSLFRLDTPALEAYVPKDSDAPSFNVLALPSHRSDLAITVGRTLQ